MVVLNPGGDICRGGEGHTVCGFYDSSNDSCWYQLAGMHSRSCTVYCPDDSCMFCGRRKRFKCPVICDYVGNDSRRCDEFIPIDIKKFTR